MFALGNWTELLLSVVGDVLLVLSALLSQFAVNLLSELIHVLSNPFLHFLVDQVCHSLAQVRRDLIKVVAYFLLRWLGPCRQSCSLRCSSLDDWLPLVGWLVSRLHWWGSSLVLDLFAVVWHLMVNQHVLSDEGHVVVGEVVAVIVLLVVAHQWLHVIDVNQLRGVGLTSTLVPGVRFRVDSLERSWLDLEHVLASRDNHVILLRLGTDENAIFVVQV